jgi:hypothetical protein
MSRRASDDSYLLSDPFDRRFARGSVKLQESIGASQVVNGRLPLEQPLDVLVNAEGKLGPMLWTGEPSVMLISQQLVSELVANGFSGWQTFPVRLSGREMGPRAYSAFAVTGRCGPLDYTKGEWCQRDDVPGRFRRGLFFEESSWDGSDFFSPLGTLFILVTKRVHDWATDSHLRNIQLTRTVDVLTSELVIQHTLRKS